MTRLVSVRVICDGCRSAAALVYCVAVRRALCGTCSRGQAAHTRVDLARVVTALAFCENCDAAPASIYCAAEGAALCQPCDKTVHASKNEKHHDRRAIRAALAQRTVSFTGAVVASAVQASKRPRDGVSSSDRSRKDQPYGGKAPPSDAENGDLLLEPKYRPPNASKVAHVPYSPLTSPAANGKRRAAVQRQRGDGELGRSSEHGPSGNYRVQTKSRLTHQNAATGTPEQPKGVGSGYPNELVIPDKRTPQDVDLDARKQMFAASMWASRGNCGALDGLQRDMWHEGGMSDRQVGESKDDNMSTDVEPALRGRIDTAPRQFADRDSTAAQNLQSVLAAGAFHSSPLDPRGGGDNKFGTTPRFDTGGEARLVQAFHLSPPNSVETPGATGLEFRSQDAGDSGKGIHSQNVADQASRTSGDQGPASAVQSMLPDTMETAPSAHVDVANQIRAREYRGASAENEAEHSLSLQELTGGVHAGKGLADDDRLKLMSSASISTDGASRFFDISSFFNESEFPEAGRGGEFDSPEVGSLDCARNSSADLSGDGADDLRCTDAGHVDSRRPDWSNGSSADDETLRRSSCGSDGQSVGGHGTLRRAPDGKEEGCSRLHRNRSMSGSVSGSRDGSGGSRGSSASSGGTATEAITLAAAAAAAAAGEFYLLATAQSDPCRNGAPPASHDPASLAAAVTAAADAAATAAAVQLPHKVEQHRQVDRATVDISRVRSQGVVMTAGRESEAQVASASAGDEPDGSALAGALSSAPTLAESTRVVSRSGRASTLLDDPIGGGCSSPSANVGESGGGDDDAQILREFGAFGVLDLSQFDQPRSAISNPQVGCAKGQRGRFRGRARGAVAAANPRRRFHERSSG